jgi:hypothetical protein
VFISRATPGDDALPVTIRFADEVGEVLVTGSAQDAERQLFKFYI